MEGRCVQHACFIYNPDRRKYQGMEGKGMDAGISSILVFLTSSISLLSIWWLKPQKMRIAGMATSITSLLYQISIKNWAGLLEIVVICSNILSFAKYKKETK